MSIKNIVIVGGGTAGWMTAAAFSHATGDRAQITLIESEQIGTIGVGEATIPPFVGFNNLLGIDEATLMANVQGTFKLGIQFVNWGQKGDSYFHPFGDYGYSIDGNDFHSIWMKFRKNGDPRPLYAFSPETIAAMHRKFERTPEGQRGDLPPINYAYHMDASQYAKYLRKYAEPRGVKRVEGLVEDVTLNSENGFVDSVTLKGGQIIEGDFFIDCSGFRGLLIEGALKTGYEDWTHWLPCDRAIAVSCAQDDAPLPYTRSTAWSAGWQWRVPLQNRLGNGHVFCSEYMSDDEAQDILMSNLDGEPLTEPKTLRFKTGQRKKFWNKNVVAIGLSAGFMEPLESTSIHLINTAITKLIATFSLDGISPIQENIFNRLTQKEYRRIRDFLILHYHVNQRDDGEFWKYCQNMDIPDTLQEKLDLFKWNGQFFREEDELFTATSWVAVMMGQGIEPQTYNPVVDAMDAEKTKKEFDEIEKSIQFLVQEMPTHEEFLHQYCEASKS
ncbi:MAG: tryptophan halogenase [Robiginitomaculum sp.]|nr:MAG: tryptophan halogenase [Robiginitomaculum sp.]